MTAWLRRQGDAVIPTHIRRLLRQMGLEALSPTPRRSQPVAGQALDPSRLRGLTIARVHQVWRADITDIRSARSFVFDHEDRLPQALGDRTPAAMSLGCTVERTGYHEALERNVSCRKNGLAKMSLANSRWESSEAGRRAGDEACPG
jgi:hypothetical protein